MELDALILGRQSVRQYDSTKPVQRELLMSVIEAGRLAPFAGLTQRGTDSVRHFFVIHRDAPVAGIILELVCASVQEDAKMLDKPGFPEKYPAFSSVLKNLSEKKPTLAFVFPSEWTILVAERRGYPVREEECLGFVQAFMALKATDLGLGTRPCSAIHDIRDKAALGRLLELEGDYVFDGMNIGWPSAALPTRTEPRQLPVKSVRFFL